MMLDRIESWIERLDVERVLRVVSVCVMLGGVAVLAAWCSGCGGGELAAQARAATVTAGVLTAGGAAADAARTAALDDVERRYPADPEHDAQLDLEAARWEPVGAALDAARSALLTWIDGIELARIAGDGGAELLGAVATVAARAVQLVARALAAASSMGAEGVPTIPPAVMTLARGLAGGE